jgi:hypothetical protein
MSSEQTLITANCSLTRVRGLRMGMRRLFVLLVRFVVKIIELRGLKRFLFGNRGFRISIFYAKRRRMKWQKEIC